MSEGCCGRIAPGGILIDVRLTPRGGRDAVDGGADLSDGRRVLLARVRAVPEKGAANQALLVLIAERFAIPKSAVTIASGPAARVKTLRLSGDPAALMARAADLSA